MKRRHFIHLAGLAGAVLIPFGRSAWAATGAPASATQRKLVVVMLRGAVDGLSVVAPYADPNYYRLRPTLALPRPRQDGGLIDLDGYFGLHPALASLEPLWQQKKLAFVHASGSPDPSRSHFDAQDYMESGTPGRKSTADGWMNRLLSVLPGVSTPTRGINIGPVMPRILSGATPVANIAAGATGYRPTVLDRQPVGDAFARLYQGDEKLGRLYREGQDTHKEVMASMQDEMRKADGGAPLPNGFPQDAARLATLMRNNPNIQLAFIALGGWDTHANQGTAQGQLANRLEPLGQGLAMLAQRLDNLFDDTTIVVMSEFGRTVRQNGNNGTDHGHGNVMWLLGGRVNGGRVVADWQDLSESHLYENRDLPVTTDFRHVLGQTMERHLRLAPAQLQQIFPETGNYGKELKLIV
jgi:uncharacterized protein (DUF1501 family)